MLTRQLYGPCSPRAALARSNSRSLTPGSWDRSWSWQPVVRLPVPIKLDGVNSTSGKSSQSTHGDYRKRSIAASSLAARLESPKTNTGTMFDPACTLTGSPSPTAMLEVRSISARLRIPISVASESCRVAKTRSRSSSERIEKETWGQFFDRHLGEEVDVPLLLQPEDERPEDYHRDMDTTLGARCLPSPALGRRFP